MSERKCEETLCWNCSKPYAMTAERCPNCCATNGNIDMESANAEVADPSQIDHDWKLQDDSFDHEFGTQVVRYMQCSRCDATKEEEPYEFDDNVM